MGKATERGETGRDCRAGVWQELGALSRRAMGEQVPGGGQEVGAGADTDTVSGACPCVAVCLCRACLSLKRWYVLSVSEEAKSSQRRKGLCQEQEGLGRWAWESGPGTGRGSGCSTVREELTVESKWPVRSSDHHVFRALMTRQAPFQHSLDAASG